MRETAGGDHHQARRALDGERVARVDVLSPWSDVVVGACAAFGVRDAARMVAARGQRAAADRRVDDGFSARAEQRLVADVRALLTRCISVARAVAFVLLAGQQLLAHARAEVLVADGVAAAHDLAAVLGAREQLVALDRAEQRPRRGQLLRSS